MKIGLISDTHGNLGEDVLEHLADVDEIWHAGDIGSMDVLERLERTGKTIRAVYGNIDNHIIRRSTHESLLFTIQGIKILITHIAGPLAKYHEDLRERLWVDRPGMLVCGHSHICKVAPDRRFHLLYVNPGACGQQGFHKFRTILKFQISDGVLEDMRVVELGKRGRIS